jgi:pimeloyl-ACP methyl ester carboxylesterase
MITPERPGYGLSDPVPAGTTLRGYAGDLRQLLDHLAVPTSAVGGASGGGSFAVAAALALPQRVSRLLLISAAVPAPRSALRGMAAPVRLLLFLAVHAPWLAERVMTAQGSADLESPMARWATRRMPAGDRRLFEDPGWRTGFQEDFREALRQGGGAAVRDLVVGQRGAREAAVADLAVDTVLVHGTDDTNVPIGLARWIAAQVPSARLTEIPGGGHLSPLAEPEVILDEVGRDRG